MLRTVKLLLLNRRAHLCEGVFDVACDICWKDGARVHGLRHWHLPGPQQAFHSLSGVLIHDEICIHESLVHIATKIDSVWGPNILDDGIEYVQSRQLKFGSCGANVLLELGGYRLRILGILFRDESEVADLRSTVCPEIMQSIPEIGCHFMSG